MGRISRSRHIHRSRIPLEVCFGGYPLIGMGVSLRRSAPARFCPNHLRYFPPCYPERKREICRPPWPATTCTTLSADRSEGYEMARSALRTNLYPAIGLEGRCRLTALRSARVEFFRNCRRQTFFVTVTLRMRLRPLTPTLSPRGEEPRRQEEESRGKIHPSRRSYSSTALSNTCAPAAHSSKLVDSASLWEMPPAQGTKIIVVGATRAM